MKVKRYEGSVCFVAVLNSTDGALPQAVLNATATVSDRHIVCITFILKHLHWLPIEQRINSKNLSRWPTILSAPLSLLTSTFFWIITLTPTRSLRSANTNLLSVRRVHTLPLPPMALVLQLPQSGSHSHLTFITLPLAILSVSFLKLTASRSSRPSAPTSGSPKCLRFGHQQLTLFTLKNRLLTYLLT